MTQINCSTVGVQHIGGLRGDRFEHFIQLQTAGDRQPDIAEALQLAGASGERLDDLRAYLGVTD